MPRRLRAGRAQDALQDGPRRPAGALRAPPVLPHRHRQLQPQDRPDLRGPGHPHRRPARGRRPHRPVQHADRLLAPDQLPHPHGGPERHPGRPDREDPARGPARPGGPAQPHPDQGELAGRRADHRRAVRRLPRRRAGGAADPRDLRAASRRPGHVGDHPGAVDRGALSRALPGDVVRQRGRAGVVDRVLGPDAPQPRPPGRGPAPRVRRQLARAAPDHLRRGHGPGSAVLGAGQRRHLVPHGRAELPRRAPAARR